MSRPPQYEQQNLSSNAANRRGIIDFVGVPVTSQNNYYPDDYLQSMYPPPGPCAPYTAAPFTPPPYPMPIGSVMPPSVQPMAPVPMPMPMQSQYSSAVMPPVPQGYMAAPYFVPMQQGETPTAPSVSSQPSITEESLREKINSKIESIMESQKANILSNRIERLTDKVQKLSRNIEIQSSIAAPRAASSTESVRHVSDNSSEELDRRLRRLAAESSKRAARANERARTMPDW